MSNSALSLSPRSQERAVVQSLHSIWGPLRLRQELPHSAWHAMNVCGDVQPHHSHVNFKLNTGLFGESKRMKGARVTLRQGCLSGVSPHPRLHWWVATRIALASDINIHSQLQSRFSLQVQYILRSIISRCAARSGNSAILIVR